MTLSPGLQTVIILAIMASVEPQVITTSLSGSISLPKRGEYFSATHFLMFSAPKVMEY